MLLTFVLLRRKDFVEMEPLKGIFRNKMYTVVGYTINQINCDDNGAYGDTRSVKKHYYVQEENGKLIVNTLYKEGNQYLQHVRNGRSYDKLLVEPSKVYTIERYYRRNKSFPGLRHMVVKVKNVDKMYCENVFCVVYSYNKSSADYELLPHGSSTNAGHPYIRTSQAILNEEDQMLTTSKPHKVYDEMVKSANPLKSSSQSEEPRNLKQVQNRQYILQKKLKDVSK